MSSVSLKCIDQCRGLWAVYDQAGRQVLYIEKKPPVCDVRLFESSQHDGWGKLLVRFVGSSAFEEAQLWARQFGVGSLPEFEKFPPAKIKPKRSPVQKAKSQT